MTEQQSEPQAQQAAAEQAAPELIMAVAIQPMATQTEANAMLCRLPAGVRILALEPMGYNAALMYYIGNPEAETTPFLITARLTGQSPPLGWRYLGTFNAVAQERKMIAVPGSPGKTGADEAVVYPQHVFISPCTEETAARFTAQAGGS